LAEDFFLILAFGCDHGGFELKEPIINYLKGLGHEVIDLGTDSNKPVDYPDYALAVGKSVIEGKAERGIVVCGSGVGACVAINKIPGIRAGLCHDTFSAHQGKEDDDTNVLCLGARVIGIQLALEIVKTWVNAKFSGAERHVRRLEKVRLIETEFLDKSVAKK
jgi:ribose 5-phosphate isomerase B